MRILLDTNILTRSAQPDHVQHQAATSAVAALTSRGEILCLMPQNLYEFWVVSTRPTGENGLGLTTMDAKIRLNDLEQAFSILEETAEFRSEWKTLVVQHDVKGKSAHDARLVAGMNVHGVTTLLTFNKIHFMRYAGITVLVPEEITPFTV